MNEEQYIKTIEKDINVLLNEYLLNNYKNQLFAWKLESSFNRSFREDYLFNHALFISTNSSILLQNNKKDKNAIQGLKLSAEIFEHLSELSEISEYYDKDHLLLLSALCFDLSGYQANGYCVANRLENYLLESKNSNIDIETDNKIIQQIVLILLKKIPYANSILHKNEPGDELGLDIFLGALKSWYNYILKLDESDFLSKMENAYNYYLFEGNTYLSHLLFLLKTRLSVFSERSIWNNLKDNEVIKNSVTWRKYIKLLSLDHYSSTSLKDMNSRISIFEFWISQLRAIQKGLIDLDENFIVQMPTSAGKTFIAELAILKYLVLYPDKKCIYIAPFITLTSEKEAEISKIFSKLGFSVSSLSGSYEIDASQDVILSETDIIIATPEKFDLLFRTKKDLFSNISFVVIDEGHIIGDISARATLLEYLIIRLKIAIPDIKTLFISAVMPPVNADEYSLWLSGKDSNVFRSLMFEDSTNNEEWEPTRKLIGSFEWDGNNGMIKFKDIETEDVSTKRKQQAFIPNFLTEHEFGDSYPNINDKLESTGALAYKLSLEGSTLIFCSQPRQTEWVFKRLKQIIATIPNDKLPHYFKLNESKESYFYAKLWYGENYYIPEAIRNGIGIHFGDMPEQVRNAVENDFRNGRLRILLSSNTIGQGLNFPIKNLIFYSLNIRFNEESRKQIYISKRDFWNIIGRAGRAGKETEGKIIFVINSYTDKQLFEDFTNKSNIEEANSLIYSFLDMLIQDRINENEFDNIISLLSETYLLDLMTEELVESEYDDIIEKIINNSLYKVQIDKRNFDLQPLKNSYKKLFLKFSNEASYEQIKIYKLTGFSFGSNKLLDEYIENNLEIIQQVIENDDYWQYIDLFLDLITVNQFEELLDKKLDKIAEQPKEFADLIKNWVSGKNIEDIIIDWQEDNRKIHELHIFISKALYYLYPWAMTSFILVTSYKLDIDYNDLPDNIRNLSSYLKYGINNPTSCLARTLGIKSRSVSKFLADASEGLSGHSFIKWISNLSIEEIESFKLSNYDKENIINVSINLTPSSFRTIPEFFECIIKGTFFHKKWQKASRNVKLDDLLSYQRDYDNKYDPYAIIILHDDLPVGFIPREISKILSSEIDIEEITLKIKVASISKRANYNEIKISIQIIRE